MRVSANNFPSSLVRVEAHPQREGRAIVTLIDGGSVSAAGDGTVTYEQYEAVVPCREGLAADVEARYGEWLLSMQSADPEYAARQGMAHTLCDIVERLLDAELALAEAAMGGEGP